jgi:hypothetical protein
MLQRITGIQNPVHSLLGAGTGSLSGCRGEAQQVHDLRDACPHEVVDQMLPPEL